MDIQAICTKHASGNGRTKTYLQLAIDKPIRYEASPEDSK